MATGPGSTAKGFATGRERWTAARHAADEGRGEGRCGIAGGGVKVVARGFSSLFFGKIARGYKGTELIF